MTKNELIAAAEALEWARDQINIHAAQCRAQAAALEAPEPAAWMVLHDGEFDYFVYANQHEAESAADINNTLATPLYLAPPDQSARIALLEGLLRTALARLVLHGCDSDDLRAALEKP